MGKNIKGISLIEVLILMIVLSLLILPLLQLMQIDRQNARSHKHFGTVADLANALTDYALKNGAYPVPSDPSLPITDPNVFFPVASGGFPASGSCGNSSAGVTFSGAPSATGVLCRQRISSDSAASHEVYVGTVPVRALGMPNEMGIDQYGRKFTYVVNRILATPNAFAVAGNDSNGSVTIRDTVNPNSITNAHFAVISHGENGDGGFLQDGTVMGGTTNCNTAIFEGENYFGCRTGAAQTAGTAFGMISGTTLNATVMLGNTANYYDDAVAFKQSIYGTIWTPRTNSTAPPAQYEEYFTLGGKVGIGFANFSSAPFETLALQTGNLKVSSNIESARLCERPPGLTTAMATTKLCFRADEVAAPIGSSAPLYCGTSVPLARVNSTNGGAGGICAPFMATNLKSLSKKGGCPKPPPGGGPAPKSCPVCPKGIRGTNGGGGVICVP